MNDLTQHMPSNNSVHKTEYLKDVILISLLFVLLMFIRYFLPFALGDLIILSLAPMIFIVPKGKLYLVLGFMVLLVGGPGGLFQAGSGYGLPMINLIALGRDIRYFEIVNIILISRSMVIKEDNQLKIDPFMKAIGFYSLVLFLTSLVMGVSIYTALKTVRFLLPVMLFNSIPKILKFSDKSKMINLILFSALIMSMALLSQHYLKFTWSSVFGAHSIRHAGRVVDVETLYESTGLVRAIYGPFTMLLAIILGMFELSKAQMVFSKPYIYSVIFLSSVSILFSATRGWMLAALFMVSSFLFINPRQITRSAIIWTLAGLLLMSFAGFRLQIQGSFDRFSSLEYLAEGDVTAGGSLSRLDVRGPRVLNKYSESPIIGFGFTDDFFEYYDGHVGWHSLLLNGGILGLLIWLLFWVSFSVKIIFRARVKGNKSLIIFFLGLLSFLIVHSTSRVVFAYFLSFTVGLHLSLFFTLGYYYSSRALSQRYA